MPNPLVQSAINVRQLGITSTYNIIKSLASYCAIMHTPGRQFNGRDVLWTCRHPPPITSKRVVKALALLDTALLVIVLCITSGSVITL